MFFPQCIWLGNPAAKLATPGVSNPTSTPTEKEHNHLLHQSQLPLLLSVAIRNNAHRDAYRDTRTDRGLVQEGVLSQAKQRAKLG